MLFTDDLRRHFYFLTKKASKAVTNDELNATTLTADPRQKHSGMTVQNFCHSGESQNPCLPYNKKQYAYLRILLFTLYIMRQKQRPADTKRIF